MIKHVCVFAASSNSSPASFVLAAEAVGRLIAERDYRLVYGAGAVGLMGVTARSVHAHHGHVIGVIPEKLRTIELAYEAADEIIVTQTMSERKSIMESRSDAFIFLPGGFGTIEELMEVIVLKQLGYHAKPLVFLNVDGIYDGLMAFFADLMNAGLVKDDQCNLFHVAETPEAIFDYFDSYDPATVSTKWF
ncbi:MAG: TIGR00730 family Rossman fold protein [Candidatus Hydrogenedentes bacterium]|nr:TIGR00730 family Rossman fold protein [Candidatus Hydrogenedentota bacterium]